MKKAIYIYSEGKKIAVKTVDVNAFQWFDKVNGNSYFAGTVCVNFGLKTEKTFKMPFQYGYGDTYQYEALKVLKENKLTIDKDINHLWHLRENGVISRTNKVENCKKRDLKEFC
jgi:hypothetical protein